MNIGEIHKALALPASRRITSITLETMDGSRDVEVVTWIGEGRCGIAPAEKVVFYTGEGTVAGYVDEFEYLVDVHKQTDDPYVLIRTIHLVRSEEANTTTA